MSCIGLRMVKGRRGVPHPVDVMVGKLIRLRRLELSMSQAALAEELGLTYRIIQKYENGTVRVSCSTLWDISETLDTSIAYFFSVTGRANTTLLHYIDVPAGKDCIRLIRAFSQITQRKRKDLLALVENLVPVKSAKGRR